MTVKDIQDFMEAWAPPDIAWEHDNVGLQTGDPGTRVRGILVALDATEGIAAEAVRRGANLIVSHHPLLFHPLRRVTNGTPRERCLAALIRSGVALYSAHTNLDFTRDGTSHALAEALGVTVEGFLKSPFALEEKIVTFVPPSHADRVASAMADAGGGRIGEYENCTFRSFCRTEGRGTFRGTGNATPALGQKGVLEEVEEVRLEMVVPRRAVRDVVRAMKGAHPYEEVAYDVYPLGNTSADYGMGTIGTLRRSVPLSRFLRSVRTALGAPSLRWTGDPRSSVRKVALCGGSGSDLLGDAVRAHADVFVTADIRYHTYQEADGAIALVDAGHYETEIPVVASVVARLRREIQSRGERIPVRAASQSTNPVRGHM